ncbi:MAG TPA: adenylate/guanylate cyclase domain-containing protein [Polyangiaceae bacterium]|nr:adenylate/guanylate cyclase domain-containing protein [Polyangiaceae bacterium]
MTSARRVTLAQTFVLAALAIGLIVVVSFWFFLQDSRASILAYSERLRQSAAKQVELRVARALGTAQDALGNVVRSVRSGAVRPDDLDGLEVKLFTELQDSPRLAEVTFTRADVLGYDGRGEARLDPQGRFQISAYRRADGGIVTRLTRQAGGGFAVQSRERAPNGAFDSAPFAAVGPGIDPTEHATFSVPIAQANTGNVLWSDLHYSELDQGLPNPRVVLSVQQAVRALDGRVVGVVRVALLTTDLDAISRLKVETANPDDPHRIALLAVSMGEAHDARLVARISPKDRIELVGDDLRVAPAHPPAEIAALLASPLVHGLDPKHPNAGGVLLVKGERYLATLRELSLAQGGTAGWLVAVLVPEAHYTQDLLRFERLFALVFGGTLLGVLVVGVLALRVVQNGLSRAVKTTARMRGFDFSPDSTRSRVRDIDDVILGLERAKTVVRAMGKYIPLGVVRRLYERNEDPQLGGQLRTVSLMFTDIEGFTTLSERLPPDQLARYLGDYLEAMTCVVEATSGTIDKYIGDAVMAFWNAPLDVERHAERACEAVVACKEATAALYGSAAWQGLPPLVTRFGLHTADVMVGHFGARSRFNYTALGDGVNLAARLEPLCKQYGVTALVSGVIALAARDKFVFRRVDRVAVKGKAEAIDVYELLGRSGVELPNLAHAQRYEAAFAAYLARDFAGAAALLTDSKNNDPPSAVLHARCQELRATPPPPDWGGVHVAASK